MMDNVGFGLRRFVVRAAPMCALLAIGDCKFSKGGGAHTGARGARNLASIKRGTNPALRRSQLAGFRAGAAQAATRVAARRAGIASRARAATRAAGAARRAKKK